VISEKEFTNNLSLIQQYCPQGRDRGNAVELRINIGILIK